MDRRQQVLKHVDLDHIGIEIGPWHSPLAPKAQGYKCLVMDVFDTETLRRRAAADPSIPNELLGRIEDVDLVGTTDMLAELARREGLEGQIDYVISSHNIEHLPDPISFFKHCAAILRPGGYVSMAIPDRRGCFDFFRPPTVPSAWIDAHLQRRVRPTEAQVFEVATMGSAYDRGTSSSAGFEPDTELPDRLVPPTHLKAAFATWLQRIESGTDDYQDAHCWVFTPSSFELLVRECRLLGMIPLDLQEVSGASGEIFAHLRKPTADGLMPDDVTYLADRASLMHRIVNEAGSNSLACWQLIRERDALKNQVSRLQHLLKAQSETHEAEAGLANKLRLDGTAEALRERVRALETSTSWRITAPLRALGTALRVNRRPHRR